MVEWRPVCGYETSYEVSSDGRVRSIDRIIWKVNPRSHDIRAFRHRGRELKAATHSKTGYRFVQLGISTSKMVHRLVARAFVQNPKDYPIVDHINGNKTDNSFENLRWTTVSLNLASRHKTYAKSGLLGAHANTEGSLKPFKAKIVRDGVTTVFGAFDTAEEAHAVYIEARDAVLSDFYGKPSVTLISDPAPALKVGGASALDALASAEDLV